MNFFFEVRLLAVVTAVGLAATAVYAEPQQAPRNKPLYAYDIGSLGLGGDVIATGINDSGQITGYTSSPGEGTRAFLTGPNGKPMKSIGTLTQYESYGLAVNNQGQVAGSSVVSINPFLQRAFVTGANGEGLIEINTPSDSYKSEARSINDSGHAVGYYYVGRSLLGHGYFVDMADGIVVTLNSLSGDAGYSTASSINSSSQIVGVTAFPGSSQPTGFVTGPRGVDMMTILPERGQYTVATDINDAGQVTGDVHYQDNSTRPFIRNPGKNKLGTVGPQHGLRMSSVTIDEEGRLGGSAAKLDTFVGNAMVIGRFGRIEDLNSLVANLPKNVSLTKVTASNRRQQLVALGSDRHAYIVCPEKNCGEP